MQLQLHSPATRAHLEDLKSRVRTQLARSPAGPSDQVWTHTVAETLAEVVQNMDRGATSLTAVHEAFARAAVPGFSFERWLAEMIEEGVYLATPIRMAA